MTTDSPRFPDVPTPDCARYDAQLGAWLERELTGADQAFMVSHRRHCAACDALTRDLEAIVADAATLPPLSAPPALWEAIEPRLSADVVPLPVAGRAAPVARTWSVRRLTAAAAALMTITAGVTWQFAYRAGGDGARADSTRAALMAGAPVAGTSAGAPIASSPTATPPGGTNAGPDRSLVVPRAELVVGTPDAVSVRQANRATAVAPEVTYEREISALRRIVDERFTELDSGTVSVLRRNLEIIDEAIADSRRALAKDPRSAFVGQQLDRALQAKLDLLRKVALL